MLANILHAARRILSRSPSVQSPRNQDEDSTRLGENADMVSTRSGAVVEGTPRSDPRTRSGKRTLEIQSTPTVTKRRRTSQQDTHTSPEVEDGEDGENKEVDEKDDVAATTKSSPTKRIKKLPVRERSTRSTPRTKSSIEPRPEPEAEVTEVVDVSSPNQPFFTPGPQRQGSIYETPATSKPANAAPPTSGDSKSIVQVVVKSGKAASREIAQERNVANGDDQYSASEEGGTSALPREEIPSSTFDSDEAGLSTQESAAIHTQVTPSASKKTHVRFGSEEPAESAPIVNSQGHRRFEARKPTQVDDDSSDADSDSDDEAPDIVTAASAKSKVQATEIGAAEALKAQRERERQKQEKRAALVAEEKDEKRKRQEKEARRIAQREAAHRQKLGLPEPVLDLDTSNLPELLPEAFLEAIGDQRPPTPPRIVPGRSAEEKRREKLNRHIKFLERGQKAIKDVKKGPVNVSVLTEQNRLLAPKVNRDTKNIREKWLKGRQNEKKPQKGRRQIGFKKMERRPVSTGFTRDEDW